MIYVASSWRNEFQPKVVVALRDAGFEVYDFRNPTPGDHGFAWSEIDPRWESWDVSQFRAGLCSAPAERGFGFDRAALEKCDACVLVLPSGMSAHLEAGWVSGRGKPCCVYAPSLREPELMYKLFDHGGETPVYQSLDACILWLQGRTREELGS